MINAPATTCEFRMKGSRSSSSSLNDSKHKNENETHAHPGKHGFWHWLTKRSRQGTETGSRESHARHSRSHSQSHRQHDWWTSHVALWPSKWWLSVAHIYERLTACGVVVWVARSSVKLAAIAITLSPCGTETSSAATAMQCNRLRISNCLLTIEYPAQAVAEMARLIESERGREREKGGQERYIMWKEKESNKAREGESAFVYNYIYYK